MENLGYYNGKYGLLQEMMIPMNDRVCWFGDGVYDAGPCHNYNIFALDEHLERFYSNAKTLDIEIPMEKDELEKILNDLVRKLDTGDLFVYYQVTRGTGIRNHLYKREKGNLWVMIKPASVNYGKEPISIISCEDTRHHHCNIKTLNLIPSVMASQKAADEGCQEAVFYRPGQRVTECAHSNIHMLKDGVLYTAPADELILPGIARAHMLNAAGELGIEVQEIPYTLDELRHADEIIVTSSSNLCLRVKELDHEFVGGKDPKRYEMLRRKTMDEFIEKTESMGEHLS